MIQDHHLRIFNLIISAETLFFIQGHVHRSQGLCIFGEAINHPIKVRKIKFPGSGGQSGWLRPILEAGTSVTSEITEEVRGGQGLTREQWWLGWE